MSYIDFVNELLPEHKTFLKGCALSDEVIEGRPYFSLSPEVRGYLADRWGFGYGQLQGSGIVIPRYRPNGEETYPQIRYDRPVLGEDGRSQKYTCPKGSGGVLDVHPLVRERVQHPDVPLWLVESSKGADSLVSFGAVAVGFHGVQGWKQNHAPATEWRNVPLEGRETIICFDSDSYTRKDLRKVIEEFRGFLSFMGANVHVSVIPAPPEAKAGADDHLAQYRSSLRTMEVM